MMYYLLVFMAVATLWGAPHRLIIIAEGSAVSETNPYRNVPMGPKGPLLGAGLDAKGQQRSAALVAQLYPQEKCSWVGAYEGSPYAMQTLLPLANAHFPRQAPISFYDYTAPSVREYSPNTLLRLKRDLLNTDGGNVILCWKRREIADLLHFLDTFHPVFLDFYP